MASKVFCFAFVIFAVSQTIQAQILNNGLCGSNLNNYQNLGLNNLNTVQTKNVNSAANIIGTGPVVLSIDSFCPSGSLNNPATLVVNGDNLEVYGSVSVTGSMPFVGSIAVNGAVPTSGQASVQYNTAPGASLTSASCGANVNGNGLSSYNGNSLSGYSVANGNGLSGLSFGNGNGYTLNNGVGCGCGY